MGAVFTVAFSMLDISLKVEMSKQMVRGSRMNYTVYLTWDDEAKVWVATSPNVIGLVLESESVDVLIERVNNAVPELLELNHQESARTINYVCNRIQQMAYV